VDDRLSLFPRLEALSAIRDDQGLNKTSKLVAFVLLSHAGSDGTCFPALNTLAKETGLSRAAVSSAIKALVARGDQAPFSVACEHRGRSDGARGRSSNLYRLGAHLNPQSETKPTNLSPASEIKSTHLDLPSEIKSAHLSPKEQAFESKKTPYLSPPSSVEALQGSSPRKHTRSSKRSKSKPEEPDSRIPQLWAHYSSEYERLRGVKPAFTPGQGGAAGKSWKNLLKAVELDEACAIVSRALLAGFHIEPPRIVQNLNRYRGTEPAKYTGPVPAPQSGVPDPVAARNWGKTAKFSGGVRT